MPKGMLAPAPDAPPSTAPSNVRERLAIARHRTGGEWTELQIARPTDAPDRVAFDHWRPDSRFLSLDAMTLLHDAFARALPGFDLFLPRLFDGAALRRLQTELTALRTQLGTIASVSAAKSRWGAASALVLAMSGDAEWLDARTALGATIDELLTFVGEVEKAGQRLWVLGI